MLTVDIILVRVTKAAGKPYGMAKPCMHCLDKLKKSHNNNSVVIRHIYYTDDTGKIMKEHINDMTTTHITISAKLPELLLQQQQ